MATLDVTALRQLETELGNDHHNNSLGARFNAAMSAVAEQIFFGSSTGDPLLDYLICEHKTTKVDALKRMHDIRTELQKKKGAMLVQIHAPAQPDKHHPALILQTIVTGELRILQHPITLAIEVELGLKFEVPHSSFIDCDSNAVMSEYRILRMTDTFIDVLCKSGQHAEPQSSKRASHYFWYLGPDKDALDFVCKVQKNNSLGYNFSAAMIRT